MSQAMQVLFALKPLLIGLGSEQFLLWELKKALCVLVTDDLAL